MASASSVLDGTHKVLTPEYVEFDFVLAGLYSRFLAWLVDAMVGIGLAVAVMTVLSVVMAVFPGFGSALFFVVWFLIDWGYAIVLETFWSGQTIGKKALGLRVIQESGVRIGFYHAVLRNLARPFDRLPFFYLVGGIAALVSASHQRFGDMLAGTIVVRDRRLKIPASIARPEGEAAILGDPVFQSKVAKLTSEEEEVIFAAAIRREELGMEARLKLFATLSQRLQDEAGFYKPPHLSDEKLVLLVAAALAARSAQKRSRARRRAPR
ncbi:MAG: RDD family protein [Myxococcales bacterium]|nr:RDD family protein [Myxococcales bacterium]